MEWVLPLWYEVEKAFQEASRKLQIPLNDLEVLFRKGNLRQMSMDVWKRLENTWSWNVTSVNGVEQYAREQTKIAELNVMLDAFRAEESGGWVPAPVVLLFMEGGAAREPYLIWGELQLMSARALKKKPTVFLLMKFD